MIKSNLYNSHNSTVIGIEKLPPQTAGLRLCKMFGEELRLCEGVRFVRGQIAVNTVLRRAAIAGHVEVGGHLADHWADVFDASGDVIENVALDAASFRSLKNHWMRCKYERLL